jgi:hypothetical protein
MKKLMFWLPAFLLSFHLMAQSPVTIGPKVAFNFNNLSHSESGSDIDYDYLKTFSYGLFFRGSFGKFYLQPEAYFATKGSNLQIKSDPSDPSTQNVSGKVKLTSLEVPLLLGYKVVGGNESLSNFRVFAGPVSGPLFFGQAARRKTLTIYSISKEEVNLIAPFELPDYGLYSFCHLSQKQGA